MGDFVHLHVHTEFSLLDGASRIKDIFARCRQKGMKAVAITDHGNMYGAYQFYNAEQDYFKAIKEEQGDEAWQQAVDNAIKPIIGCEFYVVENMHRKEGRVDREYNHLILLAKDNIGYKNLVKLNSYAFVDGFYYKPRIDFELLKQHSQGLICLSACIAGELPQLILSNREKDAEQLLLTYKELFKDDYYVEIQDHGLAEERYVNPRLIELAKKHNVELVATNDVHYIQRADAEAHDLLLCVQTIKDYDDPTRMRFEGSEYYLKEPKEMEELFSHVPSALENTVKIAEKCNVQIKKEQLLPNYVPPDGSTPEQYLRKLMEEGLAEKYGLPLPQNVRDRAEYEFGVIKKMGFIEYYLIVWDFIHYAEKNGIAVGPGRGSGASSIIAYAVGITKVEPLQYDLIFERFLNPERVSMPDFDIDFCMDRRQEVINYVMDKYGHDNVAQIITFGTMASKNAIKDVARALKVPYAAVDKITKLIPNGSKANIKQMLGLEKGKGDEDWVLPELKEVYTQDNQMKRAIDLAMQLEGLPRQSSMHAAGVVICKEPISDHIPLQRKGDSITTQFNMTEVEKLGLLKIDFLGLTNLTDIDKAIKAVKQTRGIDIDFSTCTYDDPKVFELISSGNTQAVFQLESGGMTRLMKELQPTHLEDIIAGISLFRPGPMAFIPDYIQGKRTQGEVTYLHPMLKNILKTTYGCMVYQEQIMQICREMAGFSYGDADVVRRAMSKKKASEMEIQRKYFLYGKPATPAEKERGKADVEGAIARGVDEDIANQVFDKMTDFARYAFNKPHAAGYAYIAYQTAFLKCYYLPEFIASILTNRMTKIDEIKKYVAYAQESGIKVIIPDINKSSVGFTVDNGDIRFGMAAIKGVGENAIELIIQEREQNGLFKSFEDFLTRMDKYSYNNQLENRVLNKRLIENMIKGGAMDSLGLKRAEMVATYELILDRISAQRKVRETGQLSITDLLGEDTTIVTTTNENIKEYGQKYLLALEKEALGICISGNPLIEYADKLRSYNFNTSFLTVDADDESRQQLESDWNNKRVTMGGCLSEVKKSITRAGKLMCSAKLEDLYGTISVLIFSANYDKYKSAMVDDNMVTIQGTVSARADDEIKLFIEKIEVWKEGDHAATTSQKTLYLRIAKKDEELYDQITSILSNYEGDNRVILVIGSAKYNMPFTVRECAGIMYELIAKLGEQNVKFVQQNDRLNGTTTNG